MEYLYGAQPVAAALRARVRHIRQLLLYESTGSSQHNTARIAALAKECGVRVQYAAKMQLDNLCQNRPHQNVVLQTSPLPVRTVSAPPAVEDPRGPPPLYLLLLDLLDGQNVGSILRTAAFFGTAGVLLTRGCASLSPAVSKASAGALETYHERVLYVDRTAAFLEQARLQQWTLLAADPHGHPRLPVYSPRSMPTSAPTIVLLGSEGSGVKSTVIDKCHGIVSIPGAAATADPGFGLDSLNVAVAASVILSAACIKGSG